MLLRHIGFQFSIVPSHADESFPPHLNPAQVPALLAQRKAEAIFIDHSESLVLASDTVVILGQRILNKPADRDDAIRMLNLLSGATHKVVTAVHLNGPDGLSKPFEDETLVTFSKLSPGAIERYVDQFQPFDKAGAYGAQECLPANFNPCSAIEMEFLRSIEKTDLVQSSMNTGEKARVEAIAKIDGSFFTVMGFPIHLVHSHLLPYRA
jgi:septum formation protein